MLETISTDPDAPAPGERPTKTEVTIVLSTRQARMFADRMVHVVADAAYHSPALRVLPAGMTWIFQLMSNAVLHQVPPPPPSGTPPDRVGPASAETDREPLRRSPGTWSPFPPRWLGGASLCTSAGGRVLRAVSPCD